MRQHPVLLIAFNRPDFAAHAARLIVESNPPAVYIACDGPRTDSEAVVVEETRQRVLEAVAGRSGVETLFQTENLGCKAGVEAAISWFFDHVPAGIILEDDCWPVPSFFEFTNLMLERFVDDPHVMHVGGYSHVALDRPGFRYSRYPAVWGWATWRRAWAAYNPCLPEISEAITQQLRGAFVSDVELDFFISKWKAIRDGRLDTWDYSWLFAIASVHGLAIQPYRNLVRNAGVGDARAAHTTRARKGAFLEASSPPIEDLVDGPAWRIVDHTVDRAVFADMVGRHPLLKHAVRRLVGRPIRR